MNKSAQADLTREQIKTLAQLIAKLIGVNLRMLQNWEQNESKESKGQFFRRCG